MTTTLRITADALRYVLPHVSREESRPNICGVHVEPCGRVTATDGHTLCTVRDGATGVPFPITLAFGKSRAIVGAKVAYVTLDLPSVLNASPIPITLYDDKERVIGAAICHTLDVQYPDYRGVIPTADRARAVHDEHTTPALHFDAALIARFSVTRDSRISLAYGQETGAYVVTYMTNSDVCGLIMPVRRFDDAARVHPTWPRDRAVVDVPAMAGA